MKMSDAQKIVDLVEKVENSLPEAIISLAESYDIEVTQEDVAYIYENPEEALENLREMILNDNKDDPRYIIESILVENWRDILIEQWFSNAKNVFLKVRQLKNLRALQSAGKATADHLSQMKNLQGELASLQKGQRGLQRVGKVASNLGKYAKRTAVGAGVTGGLYGGYRFAKRGKNKDEE